MQGEIEYHTKERVTIKDISAKLGISSTTVHRALAGKEGMTDELRDKILQTAREMGYEINYACEPYEIHVSDHAIHVVATHDVITSRGQTLDGPVLDFTFASTLENSIKVTIEHFRG